MREKRRRTGGPNHETLLERRRRYYITASFAILWYKAAHPCADCGIVDPIVLEFDHVRGQKLFNIGSQGRARGAGAARTTISPG